MEDKATRGWREKEPGEEREKERKKDRDPKKEGSTVQHTHKKRSFFVYRNV